MSPRPTEKRDARILLAIWGCLMALTAVSYWIAETNADVDAATAGLVLGIAAVKGHLIAGVFMEMLSAPRAWAIAMSVFLIAVAGILVALFP